MYQVLLQVQTPISSPQLSQQDLHNITHRIIPSTIPTAVTNFFQVFFSKIFLRCTRGNIVEQIARYRSTFHPGTSSEVIHRCSSFPACILFVLHQVPTHLSTRLIFLNLAEDALSQASVISFQYQISSFFQSWIIVSWFQSFSKCLVHVPFQVITKHPFQVQIHLSFWILFKFPVPFTHQDPLPY